MIVKKEKKLLPLRAKLAKKKCKKSQSSGIDTFNYLCEKGERKQNFKIAELELKKQKYEIQAAQQRAVEKQQQGNMNLIRYQIALQQQQTQQMLMFMANLMQNGQYQGIWIFMLCIYCLLLTQV